MDIRVSRVSWRKSIVFPVVALHAHPPLALACPKSFKYALAYLLRGARHALHDILLLRTSAIRQRHHLRWRWSNSMQILADIATMIYTFVFIAGWCSWIFREVEKDLYIVVRLLCVRAWRGEAQSEYYYDTGLIFIIFLKSNFTTKENFAILP